jgi:hypothetical protein
MPTVMVNASFVFGMDSDGPDVFDRTVEWAAWHDRCRTGTWLLAGVQGLLPVGNLWRGAATKAVLGDRVRHLAYAGGWKTFERVWDVLIRSGQVLHALPLLEAALSSFGSRRPDRDSRPAYDSGGFRMPGGLRTLVGVRMPRDVRMPRGFR